MESTIRRLLLANALKFNGKANPKAIIGSLVQEVPEVKKDMQQTMKTVATLAQEINSLSLEEQEQELLKLDPSHFQKEQEEKQKRKQQANELPALSNAIKGKVVTRIPPEPSKYAHLGHAMSFLINYLYAKQYDGKVFLRFDDTNPEKSTQEFLDAIKEDVLDYLKLDVDDIIIASDHMDTYLSYAQDLIQRGLAYVCSCEKETMATFRREQKPCLHREQSIKENGQLWQEMLSGNNSTSVLRLKIDMDHKNAVMRDPVIYRSSTHEHFRVGTKYSVWPMYDFETAIEEGLAGVTHVLRSNEFDSRIELQNYIASLFDFPPVEYKHYGRYAITGATTKGREIRELIESGDYIGWDDPRLVTLKALQRRGILPEAFTLLAKKIGLSKTQTNLDFGVIAAVNRNLLDEQAKRFFALKDPVAVSITGIPEDFTSVALPLHPHATTKEREFPLSSTCYLEREDHEKVNVGEVVRLIDTLNMKKVDESTYEYIDQEYTFFQEIKENKHLIHFLFGDLQKASLRLADASIIPLVIESSSRMLKPGEVVQFERYCFARFDSVLEDGSMHFWFTHH